MNPFLKSSAAVVALALFAAGCGSSNKASGPGAGASTGGAAGGGGGGAATVAVKGAKLGKALVDDKGHALYLFEKDRGGKSSCSGACASVWPPYTTSGKPKATSGASTAQIATTARSDGKTQVVYHGHPLYYYSGDNAPGDTNGEALNQFGAEWYIVSPAGNKIEKKGS